LALQGAVLLNARFGEIVSLAFGLWDMRSDWKRRAKLSKAIAVVRPNLIVKNL
jgi:hypothetical protein